MVGHPRQPHDSRRLDDDRKKQVELPDERTADDVNPHPRTARLTVGTAIEDIDVPDDVRAPARVAVDGRNQGKALGEGRRYDLCRFSMELPGQPDS